ncbi:hypothetical protein QQ008_24580 [Fulvivirgaceae bacterium BMA10]|uniref:Uncharacterized protein n=1 Tax=Splendidivirga corallicola TaxID=3051826 RepID=A0ABT8KUY2_9BACT|nr:hypothetical protein [Fulvivirgaceae bacterium BMA10]
MKQSQINRLEMFQVTNDYLDTHNSVWNTIPVLGKYKNQFASIIEALKEAAGQQADARVFIGKSLQSLKKTIAEKMDILDDTLEAYAEDTEDAELLSKAQNSVTDYFKLPNEDFETKTKQMIGLLEEKATDMADYGMNVEQVEDAKIDLDRFLATRGKPRVYRVASSMATKEIDALLKEGGIVLERIDRVLKRFKRANSSFYNGYLASRKVIDN